MSRYVADNVKVTGGLCTGLVKRGTDAGSNQSKVLYCQWSEITCSWQRRETGTLRLRRKI